MAKPFDATTKHLVESDPGPWLEYVGFKPAGPVRVIDANLSTVTVEADKVLRVDEEPPWLAHIEFQTGHDGALGRRLLRYNVLLNSRHDLPVRSVVVLLRPGANTRETSGILRLRHADGRPYLRFRYHVVRAWKQPAEAILEGGLGTLPLAPLADVTRKDLPAVIRRMKERLDREASPEQAAMYWTSTYILMGLKYENALTERLLQGVRAMKESTTYQAILDEGRAEGEIKGRNEGKIEVESKILLSLGRKRFGPPPASIIASIESISDVGRLEQLIDRVLDVSSWDELLA